jgi:FkbM family methyltransferase
VAIAVAGVSPRILVSDAYEYARARSWEDDAHLLRALSSRITAGTACWDIGANVGVYTLVMALRAGASGAVVSFEPEPRSNARLCENIHFNNLGNVAVFQYALGDTKGPVALSVSEHPSAGTHSLVAQAPEGSQRGEALFVQVLPGDEIVAAHALPIPAVVKIDVEGAEERVIAGMVRTLGDPRCSTVLCEMHFGILEAQGQAGAPARIARRLEECGFNRLEWLDRSHLFAVKERAA